MRKNYNLSIFLNVFMFLIISFFVARYVEAKNWQELMIAAAESLYKGDKVGAKGYFYSSRDLALKQGSWVGIARTGYGFVELEDFKEADRSWSIARDIAWKQRNWEGLICAGQGFSMLGEYKKAYESTSIARDITWKHRNWQGLVCVGQSFAMLREYKEAYETTCMVRDIARKQGNWEGLLRAGQVLALINAPSEAEQLYHGAKVIAKKQGKEAMDSLAKRVKFPTDTLLLQKSNIFIPGLAESWELEIESRNYVFKLKKGIESFKGDKFNADSVVYTFRKNQDKWENVGIKSVDRLDAYKVKISINPWYLLVVLTHPDTSIECR